MKTNKLIIALIIIILIICAGMIVYSSSNSQIQYTDLQVSNSCTLSVPVSNDAVDNKEDGVFHYYDKQHNLNITGYNNTDVVDSLKDNELKNTKQIYENGTSVYQDEKTGVYSVLIENNDTNETILISCSDLDILIHVANSAKFTNNPSDDLDKNDTNESNTNSNNLDKQDTSTKTESSNNQQSSGSSSTSGSSSGSGNTNKPSNSDSGTGSSSESGSGSGSGSSSGSGSGSGDVYWG